MILPSFSLISIEPSVRKVNPHGLFRFFTITSYECFMFIGFLSCAQAKNEAIITIINAEFELFSFFL